MIKSNHLNDNFTNGSITNRSMKLSFLVSIFLSSMCWIMQKMWMQIWSLFYSDLNSNIHTDVWYFIFIQLINKECNT